MLTEALTATDDLTSPELADKIAGRRGSHLGRSRRGLVSGLLLALIAAGGAYTLDRSKVPTPSPKRDHSQRFDASGDMRQRIFNQMSLYAAFLTPDLLPEALIKKLRTSVATSHVWYLTDGARTFTYSEKDDVHVVPTDLVAFIEANLPLKFGAVVQVTKKHDGSKVTTFRVTDGGRDHEGTITSNRELGALIPITSVRTKAAPCAEMSTDYCLLAG